MRAARLTRVLDGRLIHCIKIVAFFPTGQPPSRCDGAHLQLREASAGDRVSYARKVRPSDRGSLTPDDRNVGIEMLRTPRLSVARQSEAN